ncbi:MAG: KAP family NTPase [Methanosarcina barkeri]|nr:KAP family NTPase [Methanosarcina sp. ERenArc_MAG2]
MKLLGISPSSGLSITPLSPENIAGFSGIITFLTSFIVVINHFFSKESFTSLLTDPFGLKKLESNTNYKERLPFREHFYSDFNEIIKSYVGNSKVYLFIDDLDRAEVPKAAELMQAINLMISDHSKVYFSLGMDRKIISAGLAAKNEQILKYLSMDVSEHDNGLEYGYDFIEKFIQLPFKVPSPKNADFLKFFTSIDENESSPNPSESADKSSISKDFTSDKSHEGEIKASQNENNGQETGADAPDNETDSNKQEIQKDKDCVEDSETSKLILEMVAPALDNNPRRIISLKYIILNICFI